MIIYKYIINFGIYKNDIYLFCERPLFFLSVVSARTLSDKLFINNVIKDVLTTVLCKRKFLIVKSLYESGMVKIPLLTPNLSFLSPCSSSFPTNS